MAKEYISGFKDFDKKLGQLADQKQMVAASRAALGKALTPVVVTARQKVPRSAEGHKLYNGRLVSPGFASRNIKKKIKSVNGAVTGTVGTTSEAFYAMFFETGTKYIAKDPWLAPAFFQNKSKMVAKFSDGIEAYITKVAKK
jgi:HK97 gp10 family phage protein